MKWRHRSRDKTVIFHSYKFLSNWKRLQATCGLPVSLYICTYISLSHTYIVYYIFVCVCCTYIWDLNTQTHTTYLSPSSSLCGFNFICGGQTFSILVPIPSKRQKNGGSPDCVLYVRRCGVPGQALPLLQVPQPLPALVITLLSLSLSKHFFIQLACDHHQFITQFIFINSILLLNRINQSTGTAATTTPNWRRRSRSAIGANTSKGIRRRRRHHRGTGIRRLGIPSMQMKPGRPTPATKSSTKGPTKRRTNPPEKPPRRAPPPAGTSFSRM